MKKTKPINQSKKTIKTLFASLFKNQAAVDGGRYQPWWIAIILLFVSTLIAVIPTMVTLGKDKGRDIFKSPTYELNTGLIKFHETLEEKGLVLSYIQDGNGAYDLSASGAQINTVFNKKISINSLTDTVEVPYFSYETDRQLPTTSDNTITYEKFEYLRVYYVAEVSAVFEKNISPTVALDTYLTKLTENSILINNKENEKITSYMILGSNEMYIRLYNPTAVKDGNAFVSMKMGNTKEFKNSITINDFYTKNSDGSALLPTDKDFVKKVTNNWGDFVDLAYKQIKVQTFWIYTGINYGLFFVLSLFIGLVYFITTRGKYNPNRDIRFLEAMRIGMWLLLAPALITLVVGLFMPSYAQMVYIMTLGMRTVWMSMKSVQTQAQ